MAGLAVTARVISLLVTAAAESAVHLWLFAMIFSPRIVTFDCQAKSGAAYMFARAMNIVLGQKEGRQFLSGYFVVADVYCSSCFASLGWEYIRAYDAGEKYGRFVIEEAILLILQAANALGGVTCKLVLPTAF